MPPKKRPRDSNAQVDGEVALAPPPPSSSEKFVPHYIPTVALLASLPISNVPGQAFPVFKQPVEVGCFESDGDRQWSFNTRHELVVRRKFQLNDILF